MIILKPSGQPPTEVNQEVNSNMIDDALGEYYEDVDHNSFFEDIDESFSFSTGSSLLGSPQSARLTQGTATNTDIQLAGHGGVSDSQINFELVDPQQLDQPLSIQEQARDGSLPHRGTKDPGGSTLASRLISSFTSGPISNLISNLTNLTSNSTVVDREPESENSSHQISCSTGLRSNTQGCNIRALGSPCPKTFRAVFVRGSQLTKDQAMLTQLYVTNVLKSENSERHRQNLDLISTTVDEIECSRISEDIDVCFYTFSSSSISEQDARAMISISQKMPLVAFRESKVAGPLDGQMDTLFDLSEAETQLENLLVSQFQSQRYSTWPRSYCNSLKDEIMKSLIVLQRFQSIDLDNTIHRHQQMISYTLWRQSWRRLAQIPPTYLFLALVVTVISVLVGLKMGQVVKSRNELSHASIRQVDYIYYGRTAVVHLDLFKADFTPFTDAEPKGRDQAIHIRVLDNNKDWTLKNIPQKDQFEIIEPVFQNLQNGSYRIYIVAPSPNARRSQARHLRRKKGGPFRVPGMWLCMELNPQYFLHIWFANGTRVKDTPRELTWSPPTTAVSTDFQAEMNRADRKSHIVKDDHQDYKDMDPVEFWKTKIQSFSDAVSDRLEDALSDSQPKVGIMMGRYHTIFCGIYMSIQLSFQYWMNSFSMTFGVVSHLVDILFGSKDFVFRLWVKVLGTAQQMVQS
ncbi:hypothetical protein BGW38_006992 [Lunasporangiospora selenospora]|uniref:Uncharacterized protein n=1 Tax=Lunasporangiospora selenospora TaxID=979761 RepID=A0A9P6FYQ1_9FUNG|nr:hypothetical protein BGW38_006992 [Lunasporangiospora selenospora]